MPYAREHKSRRVQVTQANVPLRRDDRHRKQMMLIVGVGVSMVVIIALYAASFRYRAEPDRTEAPRWSILKKDLNERARPLVEQWDRLIRVQDSIAAAVKAKEVQARSFEILKSKIEAATGTPAAGN